MLRKSSSLKSNPRASDDVFSKLIRRHRNLRNQGLLLPALLLGLKGPSIFTNNFQLDNLTIVSVLLHISLYKGSPNQSKL